MDSMAENFNQNAQYNWACYNEIQGCGDPSANNYNPEANVNDGSCDYRRVGCTDPEALNYDQNAQVDDGSCVYITSLVESDDELFKIYPNPVSDQFVIELNETIEMMYQLLIIDIHGTAIHSRSILTNRLILDASNWPSGLYFYHLKSKEGLRIGKLMVNH